MHMTLTLDLADFFLAALECDDQRAYKGNEALRHIARGVRGPGNDYGHDKARKHSAKGCTRSYATPQQAHDQDRTKS